MAMASCSVSALSTPCISRGSFSHRPALSLRQRAPQQQRVQRQGALCVRAAAKLPGGVEAPKVEPKLPAPFWGFTTNAEIWNSRAAMIGFFALLALEVVAGQGILSLLGVEIGKGLDLPI